MPINHPKTLTSIARTAILPSKVKLNKRLLHKFTALLNLCVNYVTQVDLFFQTSKIIFLIPPFGLPT
jgi:hypothetical protein